ncbi:hypothetical protein I6A60_24780 [Frankia sp. AgB1.9]|uniref:hypothetical protein n=1 Tax=unclassified Frankia TaxID=2632575 RepID=UPI001932922E|nr:MULTISPECIES: hypothetical protein [unclassified Frankia]MBL7487426.1 hypothetical protein [Frankia sp. AgW1.1]MBL7551056.1 hypothetical protein [Frankia sp. AgB1.9]MBL7618837.1 hypothetical protein [Frankia sp. AgB1.8]
MRPTASGDGSWAYKCPLTKGHPFLGSYEWLVAPPPAGTPDGLGGLANELGLDIELPAVVAAYQGRWVEYGVVEHDYARRRQDDFARLVQIYGHTHIEDKRYTASVFLAHALSQLARQGSVVLRHSRATGRWSYNPTISWWTVAPPPDWSSRLSWAESGGTMDYVPAGAH